MINNIYIYIKHSSNQFTIVFDRQSTKCHFFNLLQESLQAASTAISTATKSWASLRGVTVVVPQSWTPSACRLLLGITEAEGQSWETANIRVTHAQDPRHGLRPWTQQSQGCGQQGDYIRVAHQLFQQNTSLANGESYFI